MLIGRLRRVAAPVRLLPLLWFVLLVSGRSPVHACAMGHADHGDAVAATGGHDAHEQEPAPTAPCSCLEQCCLSMAPALPAPAPALALAVAIDPAPFAKPSSRAVPSTAGTLHPYPTAPPLTHTV